MMNVLTTKRIRKVNTPKKDSIKLEDLFEKIMHEIISPSGELDTPFYHGALLAKRQ